MSRTGALPAWLHHRELHLLSVLGYTYPLPATHRTISSAPHPHHTVSFERSFIIRGSALSSAALAIFCFSACAPASVRMSLCLCVSECERVRILWSGGRWTHIIMMAASAGSTDDHELPQPLLARLPFTPTRTTPARPAVEPVTSRCPRCWRAPAAEASSSRYTNLSTCAP
ncbi:hypothetical protein C8R45DRAFT_1039641 [Mycena sanguinolenta]|nr:hypothetical protein C8R45DRAFT_1039641 [Mycena sanguinolenta]